VISVEAVAYSYPSSYCNTVEWFWWDWNLSQWPTGFLQCFVVIWPVKIVPEMTYKVSSGTLNLCSLTHYSFPQNPANKSQSFTRGQLLIAQHGTSVSTSIGDLSAEPRVIECHLHLLSFELFFYFRMHEMQTVLTDDRTVCQSVRLSWMHQMIPHGETNLRLCWLGFAVWGSFGSVFAKWRWPLVTCFPV